jgi:hypothetical protein
MDVWRRLVARLGFLVAVFVAAYLGATLGWLGTREVRASHNFADVPDSAFYHAFVQFLVDNGITSGCAPGLFCGNDPVTRGQMAVFLQKLADVVGQDVVGTTATLQAQITALETELDTAQGTISCLKREGNDVIFEGCNVHVRSGAGATEAAVNGLGNLIVGYNETFGAEVRTGSHNLVVGRFHTYSSYGGLVAGEDNAVSGAGASVSGGVGNTASGPFSNVSGGLTNTAGAFFASVSGGAHNLASGDNASVSGGENNTASGEFASISGGRLNKASGLFASVSGGDANTASGDQSSVSGGRTNTASGRFASVSGGSGNLASGDNASVSGGENNTASGIAASVSGGFRGSAPGTADWVAGSLFQDD